LQKGSQIRERVKAKLANKGGEAKRRRRGEKGFRQGAGVARQRGRVRGHDERVRRWGRGDNGEAAVAVQMRYERDGKGGKISEGEAGAQMYSVG
jgi:hypothetical protein